MMIMDYENSVSRRKFIITSIEGLAAASLWKLDVFAGSKPTADLVIHGSPVLTVDYKDSIPGAVAIKGNKILAAEKDVSGLRGFILKFCTQITAMNN